VQAAGGGEKVSEHLRRQSQTDWWDGEARRIDAVAGCRPFRRNASRLEELAPAVTILIPDGSNRRAFGAKIGHESASA
jgi:hypothetical protein